MKIKKSQTISVLLIVYCMYILNPFYFKSIETINKLLYYALMIFPATFFLLKNRFRVKKKNWGIVLLLLFYFFCVFAVLFINDPSNLGYLPYFFRIMLKVVGMISLIVIWKYYYECGLMNKNLTDIFIDSVILYIGSTIVFIVLEPLKESWVSIIADYGSSVFVSKAEYKTRVGFAGFSGYTVAFYVTFAFIIFLYQHEKGVYSKKKFWFYFIMLILGALFYGRIGTICVAISLFIYMIYTLVMRQKLSSLLLIVACVLGFAGTFFVISYYDIKSESLKWVLEPVINYVKFGKFETLSSKEVQGFYDNFKIDLSTLFHGTGLWENADGGYAAGVDVGFFRNVYFGGLYYCIFLYGMIVCIYIMMCKSLCGVSKAYIRIMFILMVISFFLFEAKGDISFYSVACQILIIYSLTIENKRGE